MDFDRALLASGMTEVQLQELSGQRRRTYQTVILNNLPVMLIRSSLPDTANQRAAWIIVDASPGSDARGRAQIAIDIVLRSVLEAQGTNTSEWHARVYIA